MKENPIAIRSKKTIINALLELLSKKHYRKITITEICKTAGLSRPAFYQNFKSKDEVLQIYMYDFLKGLLSQIKEKNINTVEELVWQYIDIVDANSAFFTILVKNNLTNLISNQYSRYLVSLPPVLSCQRPNKTEEERKYFNTFMAAAFIDVFALWLSENKKTSKETIVRIITDILCGQYFIPKE